ncbi:MAG: hypothetical protein ACXWJB_15895 [Limisphaerales bacterium]
MKLALKKLARNQNRLSEYLMSALALFALDLVARDDADEMIAHLPGDVGENVCCARRD